MRSPYSLDQPPPVDAPGPVVERTAWALAADLWNDHLPDRLLGADCASCVSPWPCATWEVADGIIATVCADNPDTVRRAPRPVPGTRGKARDRQAHPEPAAPPPAPAPSPATPTPLRPDTPARAAGHHAEARSGRHAAAGDESPEDAERAGGTRSVRDALFHPPQRGAQGTRSSAEAPTERSTTSANAPAATDRPPAQAGPEDRRTRQPRRTWRRRATDEDGVSTDYLPRVASDAQAGSRETPEPVPVGGGPAKPPEPFRANGVRVSRAERPTLGSPPDGDVAPGGHRQ